MSFSYNLGLTAWTRRRDSVIIAASKFSGLDIYCEAGGNTYLGRYPCPTTMLLAHVVTQHLNHSTSVAPRDNLPGFPYIDFNTDRVEQSAAFSRLSLFGFSCTAGSFQTDIVV